MIKNKYTISPIGYIRKCKDSSSIEILKEYLPGLLYLGEFSHLHVIWWAHLHEDTDFRRKLESGRIFREGPPRMGVFATRSPLRPNPVMISVIRVSEADFTTGVIRTAFIDADNNTPVVDIKPYYPMDRVRNCRTPGWSEGWPEWHEEAAGFDWSRIVVYR